MVQCWIPHFDRFTAECTEKESATMTKIERKLEKICRPAAQLTTFQELTTLEFSAAAQPDVWTEWSIRLLKIPPNRTSRIKLRYRRDLSPFEHVRPACLWVYPARLRGPDDLALFRKLPTSLPRTSLRTVGHFSLRNQRCKTNGRSQESYRWFKKNSNVARRTSTIQSLDEIQISRRRTNVWTEWVPTQENNS